MSKTQRTLGPAAFEAYMNFADSLKDGTNNDSIDRFKYRFAVKEGYIRPKKAITEAAGISLGDFEQAFKGLVGAFLPHMDEDDQEILGRVCQNLDEKFNSGDMSGAQDVIKDAMRDAGGDPDALDDYEVDDDEDEEECEKCEDCEDDSECPEGETCKDGKCVKDDDKKNLTEGKLKSLNDYGNSKYHPWDDCPNIFPGGTCDVNDLDDPDNYSFHNADASGMFSDDERLYDELNFDDPYAPTARFRDANGFEPDEQCCKKAGKANAAKPDTEGLTSKTPGFGMDSTEYELDDDYGEPVDSIIGGNHGWPADDPAGFGDVSEPYNAPSEVDYDALADDILNNSGFGGNTMANGGISPANRRFWSR